MTRLNPLAVAALGAALFLGHVGTADALSVERQNPDNGAAGIFGKPGEQWYRAVNTNLNGTNRNVYVGQFRLTDENTVGGGLLGDFVAFCVELTSNLHLPQSYDAGADLFSEAVTDKIDLLWTNAFHEVEDADTAAAFQLVLWNSIYDTDFDVKNGDFKVTNNLSSSFVAQANTWLSMMDGVGDDWTEMAGAFTLLERNGQGQNLIAPVPLPAAAWLLGAGVLGLFGLRRAKA